MKTLIVISDKAKGKFHDIQKDILELEGLCATAGLKTAAVKTVKLKQINSSYYIGRGKAEEIAEEVSKKNIKAVLFREDLSAAQQKNLSDLIGAEVLDRTYLILKIFEQRANSPEGKLQVKLAKAAYEMTRLYGLGASMDQQDGTIGTRGAGERISEYKRRVLKSKFINLKRELEKVKKERAVQREKRRKVPIPQISIVGYTNCGKSTLLSALTENKHKIYADDRLFATLDPLIKRVKMPAGYDMLFSDTVGFVSDLPAFLVEAFKSTLEEIKYSDLLIHLKDLSNPDWEKQSECVNMLLKEIGADNMPILEVFNKIDKAENAVLNLKSNPLYSNHIFISAANGEGLKKLLEEVQKRFSQIWGENTIRLNHAKSRFIGEIEKYALIEKIKWFDGFAEISLMASPGNIEKIRNLIK